MSNPVGRPTKRTPENAAIILRALEGGATRKVAMAAADMGASAFYEWLAEDDAFAYAVEHAEGAFTAKAIASILKHPASALKLTMMMRRDDPQLQPVQDRVAVDLKGDVTVRWSEDADNPTPAPSEPADGQE